MVADFDRVLASLNRAALTREGWPEALHAFAMLNGSRGTNLVRNAKDQLEVMHSPDLAATVAQFVEDGWDRDDFRTQCTVPLLGTGFVADQHIIRSDDLARSAYYVKFARPAGVPWYAAAGVRLPDGALLGISLQRSDPQGAFAASELRQLNAILPRVREILLLAHTMGLQRSEAMLQGLDLIDRAAILFDRSGMVRGMNAAADRLSGSLFTLSGRRFGVRQGRQHELLTDRIGSVCRYGSACGDMPQTARLEDASGRPWLAQVAPVEGYAQDFFGHGAAVLILSPAFASERTIASTLKAAYGLTPREASVAELYAAGLDTGEIADRLSLSRNAVRFHIKSILPKANVQRQAEFVAASAELSGLQ